MQQFITSAEACALLDRILQTSQSLNRVIDEYVRHDPFAKPKIQPPELVVAPPVESVLPDPRKAVAPVLTIKLSDLMRAGDEARRRRTQHRNDPQPQQQQTQQRPPPPAREHRPKPLRASPREVEVIYRRSVGRGLRVVA